MLEFKADVLSRIKLGRLGTVEDLRAQSSFLPACIRAHDGRIAGRRWRLDRRLTGTIRGCEVVSCSPISHEREVVTHVVESLMNKQIAAKIAITEITVR
jgi:hypothetical protein